MIKRFAISIGLILASSCYSDKHEYLYDKVGFERGRRPNEINSDTPGRDTPDYYYRQGAYDGSKPLPPTQAPVPPAAPPQPYQPQNVAPQYRQQYYAAPAPYGQPYYSYSQAPAGSRFYSNPYAIPPAPRYLNYDVDQYYVPPSYYNNVEPYYQQAPMQ